MGSKRSAIKRNLGIVKTKLEKAKNRRNKNVQKGLNDLKKNLNVDAKQEGVVSEYKQKNEESLNKLETLLSNFETKLKEYKRKYKSTDTDSKRILGYIDSFEKLYKDNKIVLGHITKNINSIKKKVQKRRDKNKSKKGKLFHGNKRMADKEAKLQEVENGIQIIEGIDGSNSNTISSIGNILKKIREFEKNLFKDLSEEFLITPPSQLENKFKAIKKRLSKYHKSPDENIMSTILKKSEELNTSLSTELKLISKDYIDIWDESNQIGNNAHNKLLNDMDSTFGSLKSSDQISNELKKIDNINVKDLSIGQSYTIEDKIRCLGYIHGIYQGIYISLKKAYNGIEQLKKEVRSTFTKVITEIIKQAPLILGLVASISGFFGSVIATYVAAAGWLGCQGGAVFQQ